MDNIFLSGYLNEISRDTSQSFDMMNTLGIQATKHH
jgi:hypothetical protein